jgi:hypothetical protein
MNQTTATANETIKVDGVTYVVIKRTTADMHEAEGRPNVAQMFRDTPNRVADIYAKRPKGHRHYYIVEWRNPYSGQPVYTAALSLR